jgi:hypothetical protein
MPILFSHARLPIGYFEIKLRSVSIDSSMGVISIADADAMAMIYTTQGVLKIRTTTLSDQNYMLIELDKSAFKGEYEIVFVPEKSQSPRTEASWVKQPTSYQANPEPTLGESKGITYVNQTLLAGGGYATAYKIIQNNNKDMVVATISYSDKDSAYQHNAIGQIASFRDKSLPKMMSAHQKWWKNYMKLSEYSIPDANLQQFYTMQMYKFACMTRADKPAVDLQGPWTGAPTPWPAYWFNLNIQLTYSPLYTANRLTLAESLIKLFDNNLSSLQENILSEYRQDSYGLGRSGSPKLMTEQIKLHLGDETPIEPHEAELSNLTWAMLYYYQHYRYSMDEKLKKPLYNILKRSVNYAIHFLGKNDAGKYEFKVRTHSPEYSHANDYNTNYDLSSLRWGMKTLLELGQNDRSEQAYLNKIREIEENLIDYPQDMNGYMISSHLPYNISHRHYSHLMMIYPYYLVNADQPDNIPLIRKSIEHWQSKSEALQGYSLSGAGSMYAMLGEGDTALDYLQKLNARFIQPNTLYKEAGPVIETPLALAASLQELSLQFWNGKVRVFPAIPKQWKNVSFNNFRTDGAFLISAEKINGVTKRIEVSSEHTGTIKLLSDQDMKHITFKGKGRIVSQEGRSFEL